MQKARNIAILFNSGIGNAITMLPLLKKLRIMHPNASITGIYLDSYGIADLFKAHNVVDHQHQFSVFKTLLHYQKYDCIYIDWLSINTKTMFIAWYIAKKIITHQKNIELPAFINKKIFAVKVPHDQHIGSVNLALTGQESQLTISDFHLPNLTPPPRVSHIVIQTGCGNGKTPYKQWNIENWGLFINQILKDFNNPIVLLGDQFDIPLNQRFQHPNILNLTGKTSLTESANYIASARLFIGQDSGLMHIAAALNTPSFIIWGGSDAQLYGYHKLHKTHQIVQHQMVCYPCNSWINPNKNRVDSPLDCPDNACIKNIPIAEVYAKFTAHLKAVC